MLPLLYKVLELLPSEKIIVDDFSGPTFFVGDLHGDPTAIRIAESFLEKTGGKVVFLGDYADRGKYQRETLSALFRLFLENPDSVVLLRGNHEVGPRNHPRYVGPVFPYDVSFYLSPEELQLYEAIHVRLPVIYFNESAGVVAVHGFLPSSLLEKLPDADLSPRDEFFIVWSDSDPLSTEFRGVSVPDPWDWDAKKVEKVLESRDLFLLKGHSPHELKKGFKRISVLFAHCKDTGGYYDYGIRYALFDGGLKTFEEIPCGSHENLIVSLRSYGVV